MLLMFLMLNAARRKERTINGNKMGIGKACLIVHECIIQVFYLDCFSSESERYQLIVIRKKSKKEK